MAIEIANETTLDINIDRVLELGEFLYDELHIHPMAELSVLFVDEEAMEQLHIEWMDLDGPTDVMSFPMDELRPGTQASPANGLLGDIVICPQVAHQQAEVAGHSTEDEISLLLTHGLLHLLGFDHHNDDEKQQMFTTQDELLTKFLGYPAPSLTEN